MKNILLAFALLLSTSTFAQLEMRYAQSTDDNPQWIQLMYAENPDAGLITKAYQDYYKTHPFVKNKHTQYYKRWQRSISRGSAKPTQKYIDASAATKSAAMWIPRGPFDFDIDAASRSYAPGAAHIYCVEQATTNTNVIYAGTATAGFWRSNDKGENWFCLSKNLPVSSVYAVEIDPTNEEIVYFSGAGTLYKSTDGGATHTDIGSGEFSSGISIKEIMIHNGKLWVASDQGLYYSTDNGNSFTQEQSGSWQEMEVHPTNNQVLYAVRVNSTSTSFFKSTNNGSSFSAIGNGWPSPASGDEQKRTEIAVSAASPNKVVALATGAANGGSGLYGVYISEDQGANWEFKCCGPQPGGPASTSNINTMAWSDSGTDDGGQYYYDVALAVNPLDANTIHIAGVQHWISTDGGDTFTCPAKWSHPDKDEYIHADIHDMRYFGNDLWVACDGGVFYSNDAGDNFDKKMYGISGTDFWGFGAGFSDGEVMLGGTYHNGTLIKDHEVYEGGWLCAEGGDNYRGFVNFADATKVYTDAGGRILPGDRTVGLGSFAMQYKPNASYIIGESSNLEFDPRSPNILYIGNETTLYKSFDNGASTTVLNDFGEKVTSVEVAWSNPDYIYVATYGGWWDTKKMYRSTNAGSTWTDITPSSSVVNGQTWIPYDITISSENENHIWMVRTSMYGTPSDGQGYDVFKSTNGGSSWTNWTTSTLNNENITNIEHQRGSDGGVYIGTRQAVYYRDNSMSDWILYNNNLPLRTASTQLIPYYKEGILKNGTNQGVWEVDFYTENAPSAQIAADNFTINCTNNIVQFYNHSAMKSDGEQFTWSFPGGVPSNSTDENPLVYYANAGNYDVTLTVSDVNGTDSQTISNFIEFEDLSLSDINEMEQNFNGGEFPPEGWMLPEAGFSWQGIEVMDANCETSMAAYVDNYSISQSGGEAGLLSPKINLNGFDNATLSFDYAYARYGANYSDGLKVQVSTDCGENWTTLWEAYGTDLATVPDQGSWWEPTCGDWASLNISLSEFANQTINVQFVDVNGYGNSLFVDNINFVNNDGSLVITNPIPGCIDSEAVNYNPNANVDNGSCEYTAFGGQMINLSQGWNLISTYIIPTNPDLEIVLNEVVDNIVIVKDYLGNAYLPNWNFNAIGNISNYEGYQVKASTNCSFTVEGEIIAPQSTTVPVQEGWNIIPYLRQNNANAELILEEVSEAIVIVKNYLGNAYLPAWNFNGIGDFEPGQGYQLKANSNFELQYISNNEEYRTTELETVKNGVSNKEFSLNTGSNMHLLIPENAWNIPVNSDDEIYAYDANGMLIGASKVTFPNTLICLWGDDVLTDKKEGLYAAEEVSYKIWTKSTGKEKDIQIHSNETASYLQDQFTIATQITENVIESHIQLMDAVPNPAKDQTLIRLYIENDSELQLELFDVIGNKVLDLAKGQYSKGYHEFNIDLNTLSAGSYLYQIRCNMERKTKRLEIVK
jgi:hypothetical protein